MRRKYRLKLEADVTADVSELREYMDILKPKVHDFLMDVRQSVNLKNVKVYIERRSNPQFLKSLR